MLKCFLIMSHREENRRYFKYFRAILYYIFYKIRYWPKLLIPRLSKKKYNAEIVIGAYKYNLSVNVSSGGLSEDVYICSIREYPNVYYFQDYVKTHSKHLKTYVGVGANIGYYEILASKILMNDPVKIFAMEPVKDTFEQLQENLRINTIKNIFCINTALGDKDGKVEMVVAQQRNLSRIHSIRHARHEVTDCIRSVQIAKPTTLFMKNKIPYRDVIFRWDIEGYEYTIVKGNISFFKKLKSSSIIMEFHPFYLGPDKTLEFLQILNKCGFELDQVVACEPLYFIKTPSVVRKFLNYLFLKEFGGKHLGLLDDYKSLNDLMKEYKNHKSGLYHYPNLHLYLSKS